MANREHVKIVRGGRRSIAECRRIRPFEILDLRQADLREATLIDADLRWIDLGEADLREAALDGANLSGVNMIGADLRGATLGKADMEIAELRYADLAEADLKWTVLESTNLQFANLRNTVFGYSVFARVDLSEVKGLDTACHKYPSTIGVDTLLKSKGRIPEAFLRGCGLPDVLIEYLPTLIGSMAPIQFYSCFISYSGKDDAFARRLHSKLESEGLRVWFAPEHMRGGKKSKDQIDEAIRTHDRLLLVLSENSMKSEWVRREIKRARRKERETGREVLFPISLVSHSEIKKWEYLDSDTGEDLAEKIREYHIPDFSLWRLMDEFEKAVADLMRDLCREDEEQARGEGKRKQRHE